MTSTKILRLPVVMARTGLSRSSIYRKISQQTFPNQVYLGTRSVGFIESEIEIWLSLQIERSRIVQIKKSNLVITKGNSSVLISIPPSEKN